MRVLLIADAGDGLLDLAIRSQRAGHQCKFFCRKYDARTRPIGRGLVEMVPDWRPHMSWSDLIILEGNGVYMTEMDAWRGRGCNIIGGNVESAAWELDRKKGMDIFRRAGIAVPPFREFTDYDDAIRFVERRGEVYFSKPCSDTADKSLSAKTGVPEDCAWQLKKWKRKHGRPPCPFLLQEAIDGVEIGVGGWWGSGGWADVWEENFEHKRFCSGDIGPNTGEMGTVLRFVRRSRLADMVLAPLEAQLERISYVGNVDVNCIVDEAGNVWPLEFTMRLGWPAFNIEMDLFNCDPLDFLYAVCTAENRTRGSHTCDMPAVGVVAAIAPYPHSPRDYEDIVGIPIFGLDDEDHWHPCEVQSFSSKNSSMMTATITNNTTIAHVTAGSYVGIATGIGDTVRQAARGAYRVLDKLSMPCSPFWRDDIGERLKEDLPALQEHRFAAGMEY